MSPKPRNPQALVPENGVEQRRTADTISVEAVEFYEALTGMSGASLGVKIEVANQGSSQLSLESLGVVFQVNNPNRTQNPGLKDKFFPTANALVTRQGDGYVVAYGFAGVLPPEPPTGTAAPFVLPRGTAMDPDISNSGCGIFAGDRYKVIVRLFSGQTVLGPFTLNVAVTYDEATKEFVFQ